MGQGNTKIHYEHEINIVNEPLLKDPESLNLSIFHMNF